MQAITEDALLAEVVRRLVETYHPERIYLFGSRARGDHDAESDYDLMVVVPDDMPEQQRRGGRAYEALLGLVAPSDVIVIARSDFEFRSLARASLPSTVVREGTLVYEI